MVYLIYNRKQNTCKIGYSKNPNKRLIELQVSNDDSLELLFVKEGNQKEEYELHKKYKEFLIRGEWFKYVPQMELDFRDKINGIVFIKEYHQNLLKDNSVPTQTELSVLYQLFQIIKFGSIDIYINHLVIKNIAKNMSLTTRSINLGIEGLIKKKIILKPEPYRFILNPVYYFQGTESEKDKKLIEINEIFAHIQELQKDSDSKIENDKVEIEQDLHSQLFSKEIEKLNKYKK